MDYSFWKKQTDGQALYPDIEWSKPEKRSHAGRLAIIGGNKLGFAGAAEAYGIAKETGAGDARVLLPDVLKKAIPREMTDAVFAPTNPSGSLSKEALPAMNALGEWAQGVLLIGDAGRSSETAILYEQFISTYHGPLVITRDAIDLVKNASDLLVERSDTMLIASFAQLQKLFQSVYYPKVLTFSMQLTNLVDAVHKFTLTYPITIVTLHKEMLVIAHGGQVITMAWDNPMAIWRGNVAARAACYWLWNPKKPAESAATSVI